MAAILSLSFWLTVSLLSAAWVWTSRIFSTVRFRKDHPTLEPIGPSGLGADPPKVSVIIPARNEEKNIGHCLTHLFKNDYPNFEIIVVDDRSSDHTTHLLENFAKLSPVPLRVVRIQKLPEGWTGKNYAMQTGSKAATGDWFLFVDADTTHTLSSISTAVQKALDSKIDLLTLTPETESVTFWEKTVQPLAIGSLAVWFDSKKLANGQFLLVSRKAYEAVGGNEAVKLKVVEDIELAKEMARKGFSVKLFDGTKLYRTRMYTSLKEILTGWTRILTHLFEKNVFRILEKIAMFTVFSILPFAVLAAETALALSESARFSEDLFILSLAVSILIVAVRFAGNRMLRTDPWYAFLHPLGSLVMVWILLICAGRILRGRPSVWKGESYV